MRIELSEEQKGWLKTVRGFAESVVAPRTAEIDRSLEFPTGTLARSAELHLTGICIPKEHGGGGMDTVSYAIAIEEVSRHCASTGIILSVHNSVVCDPILEWGTAEQKERFLAPLAAGQKIGCSALTEPEAGSDAASLKTTARRDGDTYVLDGSKCFTINGTRAETVLAYATIDPAKGHRGITAFLLDRDTPGMTITPEGEKIGVRAAGTASIRFEGCRVPATQRLGEDGQGFRIAMRALDGGRIGVAAQATGIARAAMEEAMRYAKSRNAFGGPIAQLQAIQFMLADMATEVDAARLLTWKAAWAKDRARERGIEGRFTLEASTAKLFASEAANRCASRALQIHGGYGCFTEHPVERLFRDARVTEIYEGTSEIQRLVIAARLIAESA